MSTSTIRVKARWVIRNNHSILLCELSQGKFYCLPGGTLEPGETLVECLKRELMEELWVRAEVGKILHIQDFVRDGGTTIDVWYEITNPLDFLEIDLSKATHWNELKSANFIDFADFAKYPIKPLNMRQVLDNKSA